MERNTVSASSLGSYFGVGFNDPAKQLMIDMGEIENDFDEEAEERMEIGNLLEDASLNVIEFILKIKIGNRNVEVINALDGMLRLKLDGETVMDGEPTVVENKVSNSKSGVFTKNKGYLFQVQAYMMAKDYNQALLCGLYMGKPVWKIVKRDDDMIQDIKEMVTTIYGILNGLIGKDAYPWHLVEKYSSTVYEHELDLFDAIEDGEYLEHLDEANVNLKYWGDVKDKIITHFKSKYKSLAFQNDDYKLAINKYVKQGSFDDITFSMEHPEIDLEKYKKEPIEITTVRLTNKKGS